MGNSNLKTFNTVRSVAQRINNEGFNREYRAIISPILEKYKNNICTDDEMFNTINNAIKKIHHLADTYMYIPNESGYRNKGKGTSNSDYSDHENLMVLFMLTDVIMKERKIY